MISKRTEWETDEFRLVHIGGLPRHRRFPGGRIGVGAYKRSLSRHVSSVYVHSSSGPRAHGLAGVEDFARWVTASPLFDDAGAIVGGGRGWPACPHTFVIPTTLEVVDGKYELYRCWDDQWDTWHTGAGHNSHSVSVCVLGRYASRHTHNPQSILRPDHVTIDALDALINDYLIPRYSITRQDIYGHFDAGSPACPGDFLEKWVRSLRGNRWKTDITDPTEIPEDLDDRSLTTVAELQSALRELGYNVGDSGNDGYWGFYTRQALEIFQRNAEITPDGHFGPFTERSLRLALTEHMRNR